MNCLIIAFFALVSLLILVVIAKIMFPLVLYVVAIVLLYKLGCKAYKHLSGDRELDRKE